MIKDIHDYVKEVTSEKYIGESRMTNFSINLAADILTEAISPKIKGMIAAYEEGRDSLLVEIDRQFFDEMINRFNNNNIKIDRI